jgi:hypothetical protein
MKRNAKRLGLLPQFALVCLVWLGVTAALQLANSSAGHSAAGILPSAHNSARFVFADLDGDRIPDLALVEMQGQQSAETNYSIHVKLGAGPEFAIGVNGPMGGLHVSALDVNGDDNLDLVVTSDLDAGFIEVLLNDGHGNFSVAQPGDYSGLKNEYEAVLRDPAGPQADHFTLAPLRSSHEESIVHGRDYDPVSCSGSCSYTAVQPSVLRAGLPHLGRSPPPARVSLS